MDVLLRLEVKSEVKMFAFTNNILPSSGKQPHLQKKKKRSRRRNNQMHEFTTNDGSVNDSHVQKTVAESSYAQKAAVGMYNFKKVAVNVVHVQKATVDVNLVRKATVDVHRNQKATVNAPQVQRTIVDVQNSAVEPYFHSSVVCRWAPPGGIFINLLG